MPRNTPVFNATFQSESVVRSAGITKDPRYGKMSPHHGMPQGHLPVRSYLVVPVISRSGESIGGDEVRLWVEDNGIGIPFEHQGPIWGMFERLNPNQHYEGTGIGLAICAQIDRKNGRQSRRGIRWANG